MRSWILAISLIGLCQAALAASMDETVPPGNNYDKAEFRLWLPEAVRSVRAIVILMPGSNGDARSEVESAGWQAFAVKNQAALVGFVADLKTKQFQPAEAATPTDSSTVWLPSERVARAW